MRDALITPEGQRPVSFLGSNNPLPSFAAEIKYNGAGRLVGRWELVKPGEPEPEVEDPLTEGSLRGAARDPARRSHVGVRGGLRPPGRHCPQWWSGGASDARSAFTGWSARSA